MQILQQARDLLSQRLIERVVESQEQILDDAAGQSYLSEIESLYEQLGSRLAHVNTMLSNLPLDEPVSAEIAPGEPLFAEVSGDALTGFAAHVHSAAAPLAEPLALPAPDVTFERVPAAAPPPSLHLFAQQVHFGELDAAARTLGELLGLEHERAQRCTQQFTARAERQPELWVKLLQIRAELAAGSANGVLMLLAECFGLLGLESLAAVPVLQARLRLSGDGHHG